MGDCGPLTKIFDLLTQWREERGIYSRTRMHLFRESTPALDPVSFPFFDSVVFKECHSRRCLSDERDDEVDRENSDYFPFLCLPEELIDHTFSFLSIKDRMRARVNKRLSKIESQSKYYVKELYITEQRSEAKIVLRYRSNNSWQYIRFSELYSSNAIERITRNVSIGYLSVNLYRFSDFNRDVFNLIKTFDVEKLQLTIENKEISKSVIVDSYFLDLANKFEQLNLRGCDNITPEALHQVYKMMMKGSTKLRKMASGITDQQFDPLLRLIGVSFRNGRLFSKRSIEAIVSIYVGANDNTNKFQLTRLFDGNLEISFGHSIYTFPNTFSLMNTFSFQLHESNESLEKAKNCEGFMRANVVVE